MVSNKLKQLNHKYELLEMCNRAAFFSNDRSDQQLIAILEARLATETQAKFTIEKRNDPNSRSTEDGCIFGSEWWLAAPDEIRPQRVSQLLNISEKNSKYKPFILEILNKWFKTNALSLDEWKRWWNSVRQH
jgi:hypothetical protein